MHGASPLFQKEGWRDLIPFHEYFHGDTGAGLGASHQTGWTALVVDHILTLHAKRAAPTDEDPPPPPPAPKRKPRRKGLFR